uniref:Mediator of RNA polymerase II transcription subunit 28 n=1 Tax=Aotus nancymaae TaxID=37293 RepID=A0A2K5EAG4_AOTNA
IAAPLGGMFSGQPPGPPQPPPGLPGQASHLQAAPGTPRSSNSTLVDKLESSFEACFEICFWILQDRQSLSVQKPEQVIKEDVSELRNELQRKDTLVQKHLTKLRHWQQVLEDINVQHKKPADIPQGSLGLPGADTPSYLKPLSFSPPLPNQTGMGIFFLFF